MHRQRNEETNDTIDSMTATGQRPRQIMAALLQKNPDLRLSTNDVYNQRKATMVKYLDGRTPVEAIVQRLDESDD